MGPRQPTQSESEIIDQAMREVIIRLARQRAWADHVASLQARKE